jgi:hypothetical protein
MISILILWRRADLQLSRDRTLIGSFNEYGSAPADIQLQQIDISSRMKSASDMQEHNSVKDLNVEKADNATNLVYTFVGRVHPERYNYGMYNLPIYTFTSEAGPKTAYSLQLHDSQISIRAETNYETSLLDLKNDANRIASAALDSLGFIFSAALTLEIIGCVDPAGSWHVFDTTFDGFREQGAEAAQREHETLNMLLPHALSSPAIHLALSDLRRAIAEPQDTVFHCYRAVESVRQEYVVASNDRKHRDETWNRLRSATGISIAELYWLKELAERRRHGELVAISHEERKKAIGIARVVLYAHCKARTLDANVTVESVPMS